MNETVQRIVEESSLDDVIVTGDATGVDSRALGWALSRRTLIEVTAAWDYFGDSAGPRRNVVVADIADVCHALPGPDSKGTWSTVNEFKKRGKPVYVHTESAAKGAASP